MKWYYLCPEGKLKTWTDYVFTHFYCSCGSNTLWIPKLSLILKPYVQSCRDIGNIGKKIYSIHIFILFLYSFFLQWQSHCYTVIPSCQLFLIKYFTKPSSRHLGLNVGQKSVVFPSCFDFCSFLFFLFIGDYSFWIPLYICVHLLYGKLKLPYTHFMRSRLGPDIFLFVKELRLFWFL